MCAEYLIRGNIRKGLRQAGIAITEQREDEELVRRIRLFSFAPVIVQADGKFLLEDMQFSLKPKGVPYPTFNARIESWDEKKKKVVPIFEKPTWKKPFLTSRCLVPISAFVEPIYVGDHAGEMVQFSERDDLLLLAAGIYERSVDKKTVEEYSGFSLVMDAPSDFVLKTGHHRQPVLLNPGKADEWLQEDEIDPDWGFKFLKTNRANPKLKVDTDRKMAKGWERRIAENQAKVEKELKFIEKKKLVTDPEP